MSLNGFSTSAYFDLAIQSPITSGPITVSSVAYLPSTGGEAYHVSAGSNDGSYDCGIFNSDHLVQTTTSGFESNPVYVNGSFVTGSWQTCTLVIDDISASSKALTYYVGNTVIRSTSMTGVSNKTISRLRVGARYRDSAMRNPWTGSIASAALWAAALTAGEVKGLVAGISSCKIRPAALRAAFVAGKAVTPRMGNFTMVGTPTESVLMPRIYP